MTRIIIEIEELKALCLQALRKAGATREDAEIIFADYLDAEARGKQQCGFVNFSNVLEAFSAREQLEVIAHQGVIVTIDGHQNAGQLVARYAIDMTIDDLADTKICAIGLKNIIGFSSAGAIAQYAAEQGAVAIVLQYGGSDFTIPITRRKANLSANPIGIALPETDPMFVLDISLSKAGLGLTNIAHFLNRPIETSWHGVAEGQDALFTDDFYINTASGHNGYDLSLVFQLISGALLGSISREGEQGAFILLIDPTIFGYSLETFQQQISKMLDRIAIIDPCDTITNVAQHPMTQYHSILETGMITLPDSVIRTIRQLANG